MKRHRKGQINLKGGKILSGQLYQGAKGPPIAAVFKTGPELGHRPAIDK